MAEDHTKQHTVPSCYLANFGINGNESRKSTIFYYNILSKKTGTSTLEKFPVDNNFYDVPELGEYKKIIEHGFAKIEKEYTQLLKRLIDVLNIRIYRKNIIKNLLTREEKQKLAACFAIQMIRTKKHRDWHKYIYSQIVKGFPWHKFSEYGKKDFQRLHNKELLSFDTANFYANIFEDWSWVLLVNDTDIPFITSDNPVIAINHGNAVHYSAISDDLTYFVPISPKYAVEIYPKNSKVKEFLVFNRLKERDVLGYNYNIIANCSLMVYSNRNFDWLEEMRKNDKT